MTTGVTFDANGTTVDDNWYKLAEDEEAVYLIGRVLGLLDPSAIADQRDVEKYMAIHGDEQ